MGNVPGATANDDPISAESASSDHLDEEYSTHADVGPILPTQGERLVGASPAPCAVKRPPRPLTGPFWLRCVYNRFGEDGLGLLVFTSGLIIVAAIFLALAWERSVTSRPVCSNPPRPPPSSVHWEWLFWSALLILAMLIAFWGPRSTLVNQMVAALQLIIVFWLVVSANGLVPNVDFAAFLAVIVVIVAMLILLWVGSFRCYTLPPGRSVLVLLLAILVLTTFGV